MTLRQIDLEHNADNTISQSQLARQRLQENLQAMERALEDIRKIEWPDDQPVQPRTAAGKEWGWRWPWKF